MLPSSVGKLMKSAVSQSECDNEVQRGVYVGVVLYVQHADGGGSRLDTSRHTFTRSTAATVNRKSGTYWFTSMSAHGRVP